MEGTITPQTSQPTSMVPYALPAAAVGLLFIGAFGTWVKVGDLLSSGGMDHDGPITLGIGIAVAILVGLAFRKQALPNKIALALLGGVALLISIIDVSDVKGDTGELLGASVGWGLWMTLVGSIVLIAAAVMAFRNKSS